MPEGFLTHANPPTRARVVSPAPRRRRVRLNPPVVEESPTRARRPRRLVDLFAVLTKGAFTTSAATRAQSTAALYGLPPTTGGHVDFNLFLLSRRSQPADRDWPVPWTVWVEPTAENITRLSKAFTTFYVEDRVRTRRLDSMIRRWAAG